MKCRIGFGRFKPQAQLIPTRQSRMAMGLPIHQPLPMGDVAEVGPDMIVSPRLETPARFTFVELPRI